MDQRNSPGTPGAAGAPEAAGRTVALLGRKLDYSLSPPMQNAAFRAAGLPYFYVTLSCEPGDLKRVAEAMKRLDFLGANVTVPYKEAIIRHLDAVSAEASKSGSVNTITHEEGRLVGHSTDGEGFLAAARAHGVRLEGARVLLLGAGGAGRAVAFSLAAAGISDLVVANRTASKARDLARRLGGEHPGMKVEAFSMEDLSPEAFSAAGIVINVTPLGMREGDPLPYEGARFRPGQVLLELLYTPNRTPFMEMALAAGAAAHNGLSMLLHQGAASFRLWTGLPAPLEVMAEALSAAAGLPRGSIPVSP